MSQSTKIIDPPIPGDAFSAQEWRRNMLGALRDVVRGRAITIGSTAQDLMALTLEAETAYLIEVNVVGRQKDGSGGTVNDGFASAVWVMADQAGVSDTEMFEEKDQASWADSYAIEDGQLKVKVAGATNTTVVWAGSMKVFPVHL